MALTTATLVRPDGNHWTTARDVNTEPIPWAINKLKTWVSACALGEQLKVVNDHTTATSATYTSSSSYMGFVMQAMSPEYGTAGDPYSSKYGFYWTIAPTTGGYSYVRLVDGLDSSNTKTNGYWQGSNNIIIESSYNPTTTNLNLTCLVAYNDTPGDRFFVYTCDKAPYTQFVISEVIPVAGALTVDKPSGASGYGWQITAGPTVTSTNYHGFYGQAFSCTRSLNSGTRWGYGSETSCPYTPTPFYNTNTNGFALKNLPVLSQNYATYGTIPASIMSINGNNVNWGNTYRHGGKTYTCLNYGIAVRTSDS